MNKEDHIAIFMENNRQYFEVCSAARRSGIIYTPISTHLKLSEVEYILDNCNAKVVITSKTMSKRIADLVDKMPNVTAWFMVGGTMVEA